MFSFTYNQTYKKGGDGTKGGKGDGGKAKAVYETQG